MAKNLALMILMPKLMIEHFFLAPVGTLQTGISPVVSQATKSPSPSILVHSSKEVTPVKAPVVDKATAPSNAIAPSRIVFPCLQVQAKTLSNLKSEPVLPSQRTELDAKVKKVGMAEEKRICVKYYRCI